MQVDLLKASFSGQTAREIVALAKRRSSMISDIRAYSYRADFEVGQIFDHITGDKGQLTDAYVTELNTDIPEMESKFDKRTNLYTDLQALASDMQKKADSLGMF